MTQNRLRPEIIRTLKAVKVVKIAAGGSHSLAISDSSQVRGGGGLLFSFGSNSCGQLGQQDYRVSSSSSSKEEEGERTFPVPTICDRLSERYFVLDAACGQAHSLVVCRDKNKTQTPPAQDPASSALSLSSGLVVLAMGMNSMGQCGLGHSQNVSRPTPVQFPPPPPPPSTPPSSSPAARAHYHHISLFSSPLANHSVVSLSLSSSSPLPGRLSLPAVDIPTLASAVAAYTAQKTPASLTHLREMIADSYSSLAVLNASFRYNHASTPAAVEEGEGEGGGSSRAAAAPEGLLGTLGGGVVGAAIGLDLAAVRYAYSLVLSAGSEQVGGWVGGCMR